MLGLLDIVAGGEIKAKQSDGDLLQTGDDDAFRLMQTAADAGDHAADIC